MKEKFLSKINFIYPIIALGILANLFIFLQGKTYSENRPSRVRVQGRGFIKEGKPFKFIGASAVNLVFYDDWELDIEKAIRNAKENNISVLRFYIDWGWGKGEDFDRILDIASKHGVYIILTLTDCCCSGDYSSIKRYFEVHAPFCNIANIKSKNAFKKRIREIIERKNSTNGRVYREDPTIMAWEIANELEYWLFSKAEIQAWFEEIGGYIKSLDKNHLVTIGLSANAPAVINDYLNSAFNANPIDFISFHFYPPADIDKLEKAILPKESINNIRVIAKEFLKIGKPVVMEEFGFSNSAELNWRFRSGKETANFYNQVFKESMDAAFSAGCSGAIFWGWGVSEERDIPMWWSQESHSIADEEFCDLIKHYQIP